MTLRTASAVACLLAASTSDSHPPPRVPPSTLRVPPPPCEWRPTSSRTPTPDSSIRPYSTCTPAGDDYDLQGSMAQSAPPSHELCDENDDAPSLKTIPVVEATLVQGELVPTEDDDQRQLTISSSTASETAVTISTVSDESASGPSAFRNASSNGRKMDVRTVLRLRREMRVIYGWKRDYGRLTSAEDGKHNRAFAEDKADRFLRDCCQAFGGDAAACDGMLDEFDAIRKDFGWKEKYGMLTTTSKAAEKREKAEKKAEDALAKMSF